MLVSNIIDRKILELTEMFDGFGMVIYVIIVLVISGILSALIGLERYRRGENAGMRTHALLAIGCSFLMIISLWAIRMPNPNLTYDISRIAAGAITGIGFLGAGVIIKDKFTVKGLSTATTLWICAAIGIATGAGFILESIVATFITLLMVFIRNRVIIKIDRNAPHVVVETKKDYPVLQKVKNLCDENSLNLKNLDVTEFNEEKTIVKAYFPYRINPLLLDYLMNELKKEDGVLSTYKVMKVEKKNFQDTHES